MIEILMSIKPEWVERILDLEKRWELRKTEPKYEPPYKVYIYQTEGGGVVGDFVCDTIEYEFCENMTKEWLDGTCVSPLEAIEYAMCDSGKLMYKWRIRSLVIYPEPRPLSAYGFDRPPQSWCYVKGGE